MMTAAQLAALDRAVAQIRSDPIISALRLFAGVTPAQEQAYVDLVYLKAKSGLTAADAAKVKAFLDEHRSAVLALLERLTNSSDAVLLLSWLKGAVASAAAAPVAGPIQVSAPAPGDPVLYLPITCGWFNDWKLIDATLDFVASLARKHGCTGRLGVAWETSGSTGNAGVKTSDWLGTTRAHRERERLLIEKCLSRQLPMKKDDINSNDFGKGWAASWKDTAASRAALAAEVEKSASALIQAQGWLIWQAVSEDDGSMKPDFRAQIRAIPARVGWAKANRSEPGGAAGAGYRESHLSKVVDSASTGPGDFVSTDNGDGIVAHFSGGGVWTAYVPRVAELIRTARAHLFRRTKASLYHRAPGLHLIDAQDAWAQVVAGVADLLGSAQAQAQAGSVSFKMDSPRRRYVSWSGVSRKGWKTHTVGGSVCDAKLWLNGMFCEHVPQGRDNTGIANALTRGKDGINVRKGLYQPGLKKGQAVSLEIRRIDGKATGISGTAVLSEASEP